MTKEKHDMANGLLNSDAFGEVYEVIRTVEVCARSDHRYYRVEVLRNLHSSSVHKYSAHLYREVDLGDDRTAWVNLAEHVMDDNPETVLKVALGMVMHHAGLPAT